MVDPYGVHETARFVSDSAEEVLFSPVQLYDTGSVDLVGYMGGDDTVVRSATAGHWIDIFPENPDPNYFIGHLAALRLEDPFRSVQLKFNVQGPIAMALRFVYDPRCSVNELSARYSEMPDAAYTPDIPTIESWLDGDDISGRAVQIHGILLARRERTVANYQAMLGADFTRELARSGLGTDQDTKFYWKMNLWDLATFVHRERLVCDPRSITRQYVEAVATIAEKVAPVSWQALMGANGTIPLTMPEGARIVDSPLRPAPWGPRETRRPVVDALESMLFAPQGYLDQGSFQAVDYMGNDQAIEDAARTSYGEGTRTASERRGLLRYLLRHRHSTPFEMTALATEAVTPMFVSPRQADRHRTLPKGQFMHIVPVGKQAYVPGVAQLCSQSQRNKQGRGVKLEDEARDLVLQHLRGSFQGERQDAEQLRALGAPEALVRPLHGVGFFTRGMRILDGHNGFHFLGLRNHSHAQWEIQEYARLVDAALAAQLPLAHEAHLDYRQGGMHLSRIEVGQLAQLIDMRAVNLRDAELFSEPFVDGEGRFLREGNELREKLRRLREEREA